MIAIGCKAIIMNPVESTACQPIVNACEEAGVYLICFSPRMSEELQERAYFIGPNMIQSGEAQGEGVVRRWLQGLEGKGNIAMNLRQDGHRKHGQTQ
jgi:ABC-type sugar transport system substrate-binding protein